MTWQVYDQYRLRQHNGNAWDFDTPGGNGIKIALATATYSVDQQLHDFFDDVTNEVTGDGYTAGGNVCSTPTITGPTAPGLITLDADDPAAWAQQAAGFTDARYAILYRDTGVAATSNLIAYEDMTTDRGNVAGPFSITFAAAGILTLPR